MVYTWLLEIAPLRSRNQARARRMNAPQLIESAPPTRDDIQILCNRLLENVGLVVLGKREVIKLAVVALLAEGHVLIEDVPGVGKTLLARAMAASIDCSFRRIQFTPDLLPVGRPGLERLSRPFGRVRLQARAALRQRDPGRRDQPDHPADPERPAGSDERPARSRSRARRYPLDPPFIVLATQNPYEFEGTYVFPRASSTGS